MGSYLPADGLVNRESRSNRVNLLRREAEGIVSRARSLLQSQKRIQSDPITTQESSSLHLAQYTSLEAMISMLQTPGGGLRLSDSSTMNDPEEGRATSDGRSFLRLLGEEFGKDSWPWRRYSSAHIGCFVGITRGDEHIIDAGDDLLFWRLYRERVPRGFYYHPSSPVQRRWSSLHWSSQ